MLKNFLFLILLTVTLLIFVSGVSKKDTKISGAPPYGETLEEVPQDPYSAIRNWKRPEGPAKVGIQVGHWKSSEFPEELAKLRNNTGSSGGGKWEWEVNLAISQVIEQNLKAENIVVEILPATVPPDYWADVFIAIHADGNEDPAKSGYKFAGPWRDLRGRSSRLVEILEEEYEPATGLVKDENITRNMRGYYAFSWWRYEHAIHPATTAVIAETGFLTNRNDQKLLINNPGISANAISSALIRFLREEGL